MVHSESICFSKKNRIKGRSSHCCLGLSSALICGDRSQIEAVRFGVGRCAKNVSVELVYCGGGGDRKMIFNISDNAFISIMNAKKLALPKRWDGGDFHQELKKLYKDYLDKLRPFRELIEYSKIDNLCTEILKVVDEYLNGHIKEAYEIFYSIMEKLDERPLKVYKKNSLSSLPSKTDQLNLYRVRYIQGNSLIDRKAIFHTPRAFRSKISTCRFSISGFPSLYLGTSLELCIEESAALSFNDQIIASRFEINRDYTENGNVLIKVIDLAIRPIDFKNYRNEQNEIRNGLDEIDLTAPSVRCNYLLWYPLIAACSYMRTNKSDPFAVEYIIPQFLMQWIRSSSSKEELIGIRYFSCTSERASKMGYNYVFPVSGEWTDPGDGYCKVLSRAFKCTDPRYLKEFANFKGLENGLRELVTKSIT